MTSDAVVPLWSLILVSIIAIIGIFSSAIMYRRTMKRHYGADRAQEAEEEILSIISEVHAEGSIMETEAKMIENIFAFDDKDAKDIMTHRSEIIALDADITLREAIDVITENSFSRYPVYMEDLDNIIGVIHIHEILEFSTREGIKNKKLRDINGIMQKARIIPETNSINTLFTKMQLEKNHLVIVMDEYGQTSGIITMEDILEEIVGNIQDEHDDEKDTLVKIGNDRYVMFGRTEISDVEDALGIEFEEDVETLNGFLTMEHGKIPQEGEQFKVSKYGYLFEAMDAKDHIVQRVGVSKIKIPDILEVKGN